MITDEERLESYLCNRYGIPKLSENIKTRLIEEAYNSRLQVKPYRLLQCWRMMEQYLNNVRANNVARGNDISGMALLGYDLSIVLGKYNDFMRYITVNERENNIANIEDDLERMKITKRASKKRSKSKSLRNFNEEIPFGEGY